MWSFCYLVVRCVLQLVFLRPRSQDFKELEIVVLRHELAVPRRQTQRPQLTMSDRLLVGCRNTVLLQIALSDRATEFLHPRVWIDGFG